MASATDVHSAASRSIASLQEALDLVLLEAELLDDRRLEAWLALYADHAYYWMPLSAEQENPHDSLSVVYDDRRVLETRVRRLTAPGAHVYEVPPVTSRIVCNARLTAQTETTVSLRSKFVLVEYFRDRHRTFAGTYAHRLVRQDGMLKIAAKRVDIVNAAEAHEKLVIPL